MKNINFDEKEAKKFLESLKNKSSEEQIELIRNYVASETKKYEDIIYDLKADLYTEIHDLTKIGKKYALNETKPIALMLCDRYLEMIEGAEFSNHNISKEHTKNMLNVLKEKVDEWTIDKIYRWVGFIQGVLIMEGISSVHQEREFTRPLFHDVYTLLGHIVPETVSVKELSLDFQQKIVLVRLNDAELFDFEKNEDEVKIYFKDTVLNIPKAISYYNSISDYFINKKGFLSKDDLIEIFNLKGFS